MTRPGILHCGSIKMRSEAGMTFLEVLAALALVAFLVAVLAEFLFHGVRLCAAHDRGYQKQQRSRAVYLTLQQDLAAAYFGDFLPAPALRGDETELSFWREESAGLVQVKYAFDPEQKSVSRSAVFWGGVPERKVLYRDITAWKFAYYQPETDNWLPEWESEDPGDHPALIRVNLTIAGNPVGPFVIPLKAWHGKVEDDH